MNRKYCKTLAFKTIKNNKRENLRLLAGTSNYGDMWTRDAFITSLGLFAHNKYLRLVKKVLEVQSKNLREDGLVPLRIGRKSYLTKFIFGFHSGPDGVPVYKDDKAFSEPTDSNPQFIIMSYLYLKHTNDTAGLIADGLPNCEADGWWLSPACRQNRADCIPHKV